MRSVTESSLGSSSYLISHPTGLYLELTLGQLFSPPISLSEYIGIHQSPATSYDTCLPSHVRFLFDQEISSMDTLS